MNPVCRKNIPIIFESSFWFAIAFSVVILPLKWTIGWMLAVVFHEIGHIIGIIVLGLPICSVTLKCSGAYLKTAQMLPVQEIVVAALGPIFGMLPLFIVRYFPEFAICACFQFTYNMLPFECFDGGRVLRNVLQCILTEKYAYCVMKCIQVLVLCVIVCLIVNLRWSRLAVLGFGMLLLRLIPITFPCKRKKQIVQWSK